MPYLMGAMARQMQIDASASTTLSNKNIRTLPGNGPDGKSKIYEPPEAHLRKLYSYEITQRKLLFLRSLIHSQVTQLEDGTGAYSTEKESKLFAAYKVDYSHQLNEGNDKRLYNASSSDYPRFSLMARIVSKSDFTDPATSQYLRMLRHLGRKHPLLLRTFEIFYDERYVYIFQELTNEGNLLEHLEKSPSVSESQARNWGKQIYRAIDFLGDHAIAHCDVAPNHLLIKSDGRHGDLKLTGFKNAIIYWDAKAQDIIYNPCRAAEKQKSDGPNFQAPEVYGNPDSEEYDPIIADTWSIGANIYYMLANEYPFNMTGDCSDIDGEIRSNVSRIGRLSSAGQEFLYNMLRANANNRMPFDFIAKSEWLMSKKSESGKHIIMESGSKTLEKVKIKSKAPASGPGPSASGTNETGKSGGTAKQSTQPTSAGGTSGSTSSSPAGSNTPQKSASSTMSKTKIKIKSKRSSSNTSTTSTTKY